VSARIGKRRDASPDFTNSGRFPISMLLHLGRSRSKIV
jgi:hypothetical protein